MTDFFLLSDSPGDSAEEEDSEKDIEESEEEDENDDCGDEGTELLLKEGDNSPPSSSSRPKKEISHIAATAESLQPKGYTLATTKVSFNYPYYCAQACCAWFYFAHQYSIFLL